MGVSIVVGLVLGDGVDQRARGIDSTEESIVNGIA